MFILSLLVNFLVFVHHGFEKKPVCFRSGKAPSLLPFRARRNRLEIRPFAETVWLSVQAGGNRPQHDNMHPERALMGSWEDRYKRSTNISHICASQYILVNGLKRYRANLLSKRKRQCVHKVGDKRTLL